MAKKKPVKTSRDNVKAPKAAVAKDEAEKTRPMPNADRSNVDEHGYAH